jgi:5'-3' exonuclease
VVTGLEVHLLDGTFELFRAWFGAPRAAGPDGREVGAVRGLLRSLAAWLREGRVTHAACAFDTVIESFRNQLFAGYKTAEGVEAELLAQFPLAERAAAALGLAVWPMREFEADDALATGAARLAGRDAVGRVLLCTPDKDLAQCVDGGRVVQFDRKTAAVTDADGVRARFGVEPASIPDWLGLVGDAADGLPGVPKWGAKSASTLLARYRTIEAIPADPAAWDVKVRGAAALSASLEEQREAAALWKRLATLRRDVPLDAEPDALRWRGPDREGLAALCAELGIAAPRI